MLLRETNSDGWEGASWCEPLEPRLFLAAVGPTEVRGDFTGDGRVDIVTTRGGLKLRVGTAKGFKAGVPINGVGFARGGSVAAADFNNDGALDLAVFGGNSAPGTLKRPNGTRLANGGLFQLLNKGNGTFQSATPIAKVNASQVPNGVVVTGDFNLDGKADVVVTASASSTPTQFNNVGTGTGTAPTATGTNGGTTGVLGTPTSTLGTGTTNVLGGTTSTGTTGGVTGFTSPAQPGSAVGPPAAPTVTIVIDGNGNGTFQPARRVR